MAALCNSGQDQFACAENGEVGTECKSANIDYSQDLWLANSEDAPDSQSLGQVEAKAKPSHGTEAASHVTQAASHVTQAASSDNYVEAPANSSAAIDRVNTEVSHSQDHVWSNGVAGTVSCEPLLQARANYMNGIVEPSHLELNSSGRDKDFACLVPAGSFETSGDNQDDRTFTSLMPVAVIGVADEAQRDHPTATRADHQQVVLYTSNHQLSQDQTGGQYSQVALYTDSTQLNDPVEVAAAENCIQPEAQVVYLCMDRSGQIPPADQSRLISPAPVPKIELEEKQPPYHHYSHISTLPFVQNGAPSSQFHSLPLPTASTGSQPRQIMLKTEFNSDPAKVEVIDRSNLSPSAQSETNDDQDDEEDEEDDEDNDEDEDFDDEIDEDAIADMGDHSEEFSDFTCPVCKESFIDQPALEHHMNNHPPLKTFICQTCGKGFATRRYLKYHRKNHCKRAGSYEGRSEDNEPYGDTKRFVCNVCSRPFLVLKCMKVHKKKKHGIMKEHTCHNCAVTFDTSSELVNHSCDSKSVSAGVRQLVVQYAAPPLLSPNLNRKRKLKNARPTCDICGKTFSDRISVDIHRVKHIEEEVSPCDMCSEETGSACHHLAVHFRIRFFTDDNQHILDDQKAAVASQDQSRSDNAVSTAAFVHQPGLSTPQSASATAVYLANPAVNLLSGLSYSAAVSTPVFVGDLASLPSQAHYSHEQSDYSQKQSENHVYVTNHQATEVAAEIHPDVDSEDQEEDEDASQDVDFQDSEVSAATHELKTPERASAHMCDICNKSFGDGVKLELHYKSTHLDERPYHCQVCTKSFFTKWKLQRHTLSHLEHKPHSCPMCSKSFVERGKLEGHYRTHLGSKPFKCDQCSKAFTVKSQLSIHQRRIHSSDQPFACLVCGKAFLWKSGLEKHMRKHTREKPFTCALCGVRYSNKANLVVHTSKVHSQTYVDKPNPSKS